MKNLNGPEYACISVLRRASGDCSMGGLSTKHHSVRVVAEISKDEQFKPEIIERLKKLEVYENEVVLIRHSIEACAQPYFSLHPLSAVIAGQWTMAGGNYAVSGDSRWRARFPYPLPIHDRIES